MHTQDANRGIRFVDAHVHVMDARGLDDAAAAGVHALRDAGTRTGAGIGIRRPEREERVPKVISSGRALYKKGGYGSLLGVPVDDQEEMTKVILELKNEGAAIIKVVASGLVSLSRPGAVTPGGFSRDELQFIVREAGCHGLAVMAHANGEDAILAAVDAGVCSVEHGFFMTERALRSMASQGTFWVPTAGALARAAESGALSPLMKDYISQLIRMHVDMINRAHQLGILLAIGTDCLLPDPSYHAKYNQELRYFELAGISAPEVVKIACRNGARLLGIECQG